MPAVAPENLDGTHWKALFIQISVCPSQRSSEALQHSPGTSCPEDAGIDRLHAGHKAGNVGDDRVFGEADDELWLNFSPSR